MGGDPGAGNALGGGLGRADPQHGRERGAILFSFGFAKFSLKCQAREFKFLFLLADTGDLCLASHASDSRRPWEKESLQLALGTSFCSHRGTQEAGSVSPCGPLCKECHVTVWL